MGWIFRYLTSSVGKKQVMALTGLLLILFLVGHLGGNFLLFLGAEPFNSYSHALISNPLIIPIELGLLAIFLVHIGLAIWVSIENKLARPDPYAHPLCEGKQGLSSSTMLITGGALILFVIVHLLGLKYGTYYWAAAADGTVIRDVYKLVLEYLKNPGMVLFYGASMIVLGIHLTHAFWSACQTIGLSHKKYTPLLRGLSILLALGLAGGFLVVVIFANQAKVG